MIARVTKALSEKEKGFTLIELLVVIIIIGILAAIAIPAFLGQREKAVDTGVKSDLRTVATEVESYYVDEQKYPDATAAATLIDDVNTSDDETVITYAVVGDGYTLTATNPKGSDTTVAPGIVYDSSLGGLQ